MSSLTVNETAMIVGIPPDALRVDLKRDVISALRDRHYGRNRILFAWEDLPVLGLIYAPINTELWEASIRHQTFAMYRELVVPLPLKKRAASWSEARHHLVTHFEPYGARMSVRSGSTHHLREESGWWLRIDKTVMVDVKPGYDRVADRADLYSRGLERIESKRSKLNGEPVFRDTRLPVRQIGAMYTKGDSIEDLRTDYPYLTVDDIEFAKLYWKANPPVGRPVHGKTGPHENLH
jgi:uncharacterized protein (DUF433 family)